MSRLTSQAPGQAKYSTRFLKKIALFSYLYIHHGYGLYYLVEFIFPVLETIYEAVVCNNQS